MNEAEIQRLAGAVNSLRPEWPTASVRSFITAKLAHRAYQDAALALAYIATDPKTKTPARVLEAGPWWHTNPNEHATPRNPIHVRQPKPDAPLASYWADQARAAFDANRAEQCACGVRRQNCNDHRETEESSA